jgi:DNA-binding GntR family transcriptional regulator
VSTVERVVLREQVKDALLQRILRGDLQPGDRLVETRIAHELGTSQAPVREALRDLELLRLVESQPFKGARVRALGDEELIEIYPVRAALEELAARLATPRLGGDVDLLERELDAMRAAAATGDLRRLVQHDFAFHRVIVQAAANEVLEQCWRGLGVEGRITLTIYGTAIEPEQAAELHVPIVEAIGSGSAASAGREARRHVEQFARIAMRTRRS